MSWKLVVCTDQALSFLTVIEALRVTLSRRDRITSAPWWEDPNSEFSHLQALCYSEYCDFATGTDLTHFEKLFRAECHVRFLVPPPIPAPISAFREANFIARICQMPPVIRVTPPPKFPIRNKREIFCGV